MKRIRLPGHPGSSEFNAAYEIAVAGEKIEVAHKRTRPGSFSALVVAFYNSHSYRSLRPSTQRTYRGIAEGIRNGNGDSLVANITAKHIRLGIQKRGQGAAVNFLKVTRILMRLAVDLGFRHDDPCQGIKPPRGRKNVVGYMEWKQEDIDRFKQAHPIGTKARLALALALETTQRRGDIVRMGRQHEKNGEISIRQEKTGVDCTIPIRPDLRAAINAVAGGNMTYLVTQHGKPFSVAGFGNWFQDQCKIAGLVGLSVHGLRKAGIRRLADAGCTTHEIMAISGHKTLKEIERYTRGYDRVNAGREAMRKIGGIK